MISLNELKESYYYSNGEKTWARYCVLASEYYDAQEYIRNYDEFIAYSKEYRELASEKDSSD